MPRSANNENRAAVQAMEEEEGEDEGEGEEEGEEEEGADGEAEEMQS